MTTRRRAVVVLAPPAALVLSACATPPGAGDAAPSSAVAAVSEPAGVAPDLVYVTEVAGFELAAQSVGVVGADVDPPAQGG